MKIKSPLELVLLALLLLAVLLPIGMLHSVSSTVFFIIFFLHLVLLSFASFTAVFQIYIRLKAASRSFKLILLLTIALVILTLIPGAVLPVTARDALTHHLAIPKLWIEQDKILPTPWHVWSFYPMIIQLSFTALLQIASEQFCSIYIMLFLPLTAFSAIKISELLNNKKSSQICTCISLLLTPVLLKLSSIPLVDLPLVFLCGTGIYFLFKLQDEPQSKKIPYLAGISWGLALSCKLNALPAFALALLIFAATSLTIQKNKLQTIRQYLIISLVALLCFSPWMIRNWLWASNPLYPYLSSLFGQHVQTFDSGLQGLNPLQQRLLLYRESPLEVALLPFRIFIDGQDENPRLFDGRLSVLLLAGLIFGFFKLKDSKLRQLTIYSFAFTIFAIFSMSTRVRYLAPVFVSLAVLSGSVLAAFESRKWIWISSLALLTQLFLSFQYVLKNFPIAEAYAYSAGQLSKSQYLEANIPEYPVIQYCNSQLPKNAKIPLIYTGNQFYLYNSQVFSAGHTSADQVLEWLHTSKTLEELVIKVKSSNYNYFIIEDSRLMAVMTTALSQAEKELWNSFRVNYLSPLYSARGYTLYKIQ